MFAYYFYCLSFADAMPLMRDMLMMLSSFHLLHFHTAFFLSSLLRQLAYIFRFFFDIFILLFLRRFTRRLLSLPTLP